MQTDVTETVCLSSFCLFETINVDEAVANFDVHRFMRANILQRHRRRRPGYCETKQETLPAVFQAYMNGAPKKQAGQGRALPPDSNTIINDSQVRANVFLRTN